MARYRVEGDVVIPFVTTVEAPDFEAAMKAALGAATDRMNEVARQLKNATNSGTFSDLECEVTSLKKDG